MGHGPTIACDRTRALASAVLDDVGGEFERRLVDAHLASCPACAEICGWMERSVEELRAAPLEDVPFRVHVARRAARRGVVAQRSIAAAAAVLGAAFVGTLVQQLPSTLDAASRQAATSRPSLVDDASLKPLVRGSLVAISDSPELKPALPAVN